VINRGDNSIREPASVVGCWFFSYVAAVKRFELFIFNGSNVRNFAAQKFEKFGIFGIYKSEENESEI
jgi:hypothetical protein